MFYSGNLQLLLVSNSKGIRCYFYKMLAAHARSIIIIAAQIRVHGWYNNAVGEMDLCYK